MSTYEIVKLLIILLVIAVVGIAIFNGISEDYQTPCLEPLILLKG